MPTQHVDGLEQLVSRIAADPRTTSLVEQLRYRPVARLIPGQAPRRFSAAVVRDGITRASAVQMQVDVSDLAQVQALAELLLGAEQGSGHAVRFAAEAADLTISGPRTAPAPFRLAYRSTERVGDKTHVRLSRTKLADQDQVAVFVTQRRYDGLP
jgi:HEAT repeat protein